MATAVSTTTPLSRTNLGRVGTGSILKSLKHRSNATPLSRTNMGLAGSGTRLEKVNIRSAATPLSKTIVEHVRNGSILETLEHLRQTGKHELPEDLTLNAPGGSTIRHDDWVALAEMPVIDLSLLQTDRAGIVRRIYKAASEWGLFQVVNHGIPLEVLQDAQAQGLKFFDLPLEVKKAAGLSGTKNEGPRMDGGGLGTYVGDNTKQNVSSLYWAESLAFNFERREDIWPDGDDSFSDAVTKYGSGLDAVCRQVLGLIAESLGLPTEIFAGPVDGNALLRWNLYPACPRPTDIIGAAQHTDPFILTLLLQDKVGGLQIQKDGEWVGVRPIEGALTINIGDSLHAWTNGIFKSVLHRVVVNEEVHRLSIAAFFNVDPHFNISAPEKLVDDSHPRRYKPFTIMEYIGYTKRARDENKGTVRNGVAVLEDKFKFEELVDHKK